MKKIINLFLLLSLSFNCLSQDKYPFDWNGKTFIDSLKKSKVEKIISYKSYYPGASILFDDKESECYPVTTYYDLYVFWQNSKDIYIKRFNNCQEFRAVHIDSTSLFNYVSKNWNTFIAEKERINNREKKQKTIIVSAHSDRVDVRLVDKDSELNLFFDDAEIENNRKIYFDFEKTHLAHLRKSLEEAIKNKYFTKKE